MIYWTKANTPAKKLKICALLGAFFVFCYMNGTLGIMLTFCMNLYASLEKTFKELYTRFPPTAATDGPLGPGAPDKPPPGSHSETPPRSVAELTTKKQRSFPQFKNAKILPGKRDYLHGYDNDCKMHGSGLAVMSEQEEYDASRWLATTAELPDDCDSVFIGNKWSGPQIFSMLNTEFQYHAGILIDSQFSVRLVWNRSSKRVTLVNPTDRPTACIVCVKFS